MPGAALSVHERDEISVALCENREMPWAQIARRVGRHPTTVMREVARNGGRRSYRPATADKRAERYRRRPRQLCLAVPGPLRDRINTELGVGRSPEAIWADLVADDVAGRPCVETIYTAVYAGVFEHKASDCLRSRRRRRRSRQQRHPSTRPALPNINQRPVVVNERAEAGHWEADQIIGAHNRSSMLALTERQSRFLIPITMPLGYAADDVLAGLVEACEQIPPHLLRSITFDQGSEWARWETLAGTYGIDCWFCDPHAPWQRGQIENQNRALRWWFPRGIDLGAVAQADADRAASIINGQRRRNLDYQSPTSLYTALTVQ